LNDYEIMLLLDPELTDERGDEIIQRIRTSVEGANGTWDGHEPWGRRRLEYEIDHKGEAVYHLLLLTAPAETLAEITRVLKITDGVLRHGAYRRVKGASLKAPAQSPAPTPAVSEPAVSEPAVSEPVATEPVATETEPEPAEAAEPVTSEPADDTAQVAE
jgi:small subunit ribosomal protein S6